MTEQLRDEVAKAIARSMENARLTDEGQSPYYPEADAAIAIVAEDLRNRAKHFEEIDEGYHANALNDVADAYLYPQEQNKGE